MSDCSCPQMAVHSFVAKVVPWVVCIVHSHFLDMVLVQKCADVFEKFPFQLKQKQKKSNPTTIVCLRSILVYVTSLQKSAKSQFPGVAQSKQNGMGIGHRP